MTLSTKADSLEDSKFQIPDFQISNNLILNLKSPITTYVNYQTVSRPAPRCR